MWQPERHATAASDWAGSSVGRGALCKGEAFWGRGGKHESKGLGFGADSLPSCQNQEQIDNSWSVNDIYEMIPVKMVVAIAIAPLASVRQGLKIPQRWGAALPSQVDFHLPLLLLPLRSQRGRCLRVPSSPDPSRRQTIRLVASSGWWLCLASHGSAEGHGLAAAERLSAAALQQEHSRRTASQHDFESSPHSPAACGAAREFVGFEHEAT